MGSTLVKTHQRVAHELPTAKNIATRTPTNDHTLLQPRACHALRATPLGQWWGYDREVRSQAGRRGRRIGGRVEVQRVEVGCAGWRREGWRTARAISADVYKKGAACGTRVAEGVWSVE